MKRKLRKYRDYVLKSVLDIGCGDMPYRDLFPFHYSYTGTNSARYYKGCIPNGIVVNDGCALPFMDNSFDSVLNFQVLPVFKDMNLFFAEVHRVLKPNGFFLLTSDFMYPLWNKPDNYFRASSFGLAQLAGRNGYKVIAVEPFGGFWVMAARVFHKYMIRQMGRLKGYRAVMWFPFAVLQPLIINTVFLVFTVLDWIVRDTDFTTNYLILMQKK